MSASISSVRFPIWARASAVAKERSLFPSLGIALVNIMTLTLLPQN